jgi:hypothetical protein
VLDVGRVAKEECALTQAIASADTSRNLLMVAGGGLISGILTPLLPALIDHIVGLPGQLRISLIAAPFLCSSSFWRGASAPIPGGRRGLPRSSP